MSDLEDTGINSLENKSGGIEANSNRKKNNSELKIYHLYMIYYIYYI